MEDLLYQPCPSFGDIAGFPVSSLTYCVTSDRLHHLSEPASSRVKWEPIIYDRVVVKTQRRKYVVQCMAYSSAH